MGYYVCNPQDMHKAKGLTTWPDESAGIAAARTAPKTFQFVAANPTSDAERSQNKILVRSNASNFHWKRLKKSSDPSASKGVSRRRSSNHSQTRSSRRALASHTPRTNESSSTESERSTPNHEEDQLEPLTNSSIDEELLRTPDYNLSALVVSGHYDPFETYPCDLPKKFVNPILDQSELLSSTEHPTMSDFLL